MDKTADKKIAMKHLVKRLHEGADPEIVKDDFRNIVQDITPIEIAKIEEELVNEGLPFDEITTASHYVNYVYLGKSSKELKWSQ